MHTFVYHFDGGREEDSFIMWTSGLSLFASQCKLGEQWVNFGPLRMLMQDYLLESVGIMVCGWTWGGEMVAGWQSVFTARLEGKDIWVHTVFSISSFQAMQTYGHALPSVRVSAYTIVSLMGHKQSLAFPDSPSSRDDLCRHEAFRLSAVQLGVDHLSLLHLVVHLLASARHLSLIHCFTRASSSSPGHELSTVVTGEMIVSLVNIAASWL